MPPRSRRAGDAVSRFVLPRLGTISPWASKATELLHGAGLPVKRVERGTRIDLAGWPQEAAAQAAVARLLHDPMTQSLLADRDDAAALFVAPARGVLERIPLAQLEAANVRLGLALADDEIEYLRDALRRTRPRPGRRRTDDVRAGQFRALPAQDLQRFVDDRRS